MGTNRYTQLCMVIYRHQSIINKQKHFMKKLKLFALGLIGASMFMTSCADDSDEDPVGPTLTVTEENSEEGVVSGKVEIAPGDSLYFQWDARAGDAKLKTFEIELDGKSLSVVTEEGNDLSDDIKSASNESYQDGVMFYAGNSEGTNVYTFIVTDRDGESETVDIEVNVKNPSTDLSAEQSFQWKRVGSAAGTGLDQFGLKWESNSSTAAIIATSAADKFVELPTSAYSVTTKEELVLAITNATAITKFEGVSSQASNSNLNIVLATMVGTDVYIMKLVSSTVATGASTTITIDGMYKMGS